LDLEIADHQQVLPPRPRATRPASSPADRTTIKLHPVGRGSAANQPPVTQRMAQPPLRAPAPHTDGRLAPPPTGPPTWPRPQPPLHFDQRPTDGRHAHQAPANPEQLPGSAGEHLLQCAFGTSDRALRFYRDQVLDHLNDAMIAFVGRMELAFIGTADASGECDASLRAGPPGFLHVLDARRLTYPEYRGNGVLASLGNISENPHVGLLMVDFTEDLIGLHVNGRARIVEDADLRAEQPDLPAEIERGRTPERWVVVHVEEAYVHCRKHIPRMQVVPRNREWGTDDARRKGADYFGVRARQGANTR
jgi:uncharacterized protein